MRVEDKPVVAAEPSPADSVVIGSFTLVDPDDAAPAFTPETPRRLHAPPGVATDLATEHSGTNANTRDGVRQVERLNAADLDL